MKIQPLPDNAFAPTNRQDHSKLQFQEIAPLVPPKKSGTPGAVTVDPRITAKLKLPTDASVDDVLAALDAAGFKPAPATDPAKAAAAITSKGRALGLSERECAMCIAKGLDPAKYAAKRAEIEERSPRSVKKEGSK